MDDPGASCLFIILIIVLALFFVFAYVVNDLQAHTIQDPTVHVDYVELNHHYDFAGKLVFKQLIFWTWDGQRHVVAGWRFPEQTSMNSRTMVWFDKRVRRVKAKWTRTTWTQYDREVEDRKVCPPSERVGIGAGL